MYKYCNCKDMSGVYDTKKAASGRNPWRIVETDEDDRCNICGYYAFVVKKPIESYHANKDKVRNVLHEEHIDVTIKEYLRAMGAYESANGFKFRRYKSF